MTSGENVKAQVVVALDWSRDDHGTVMPLTRQETARKALTALASCIVLTAEEAAKVREALATYTPSDKIARAAYDRLTPERGDE